MNTIRNVITSINSIVKQLSAVYSDPVLCDQYAWWLLEAITRKTKAELIVQQEPLLTTDQQKQLVDWLHALIVEKEPLQYLLGSVPFGDVEILVQPPTLIPRPETEEWCLNLIEQLQQAYVPTLSVLDMCCGSGCIAIATAKAFPQATIYAADIAPAAVALTKKNALHNGVANVTCLQSDLFSQIPSTACFDLIISNPPYIAADEWKSLDDSVTAWEDRNALISDDNGLAIIKQIIIQAPNFIRPNNALEQLKIPHLMIEIGYQQGKAVALLMEQANYNDVVIHKDLEGKDRVVSGRISHVATTKYQQ